MRVALWGTRGSVASPGPETVRYGGNTSCVEVRAGDGTLLVLDAGTGIRRLGQTLAGVTRIDLFLTHLHMDHIQGLGFFDPLYDPGANVHIWGPASTTQDLRERLSRYLSPPLFPVRLRDLPCAPEVHNVPFGTFQIGGLSVSAGLVCHPPPTVGYRVTENGTTLAYMPDHEPMLGWEQLPRDRDWISGHELAAGADLLIHDTQYTDSEYEEHVGWGHCAISQAIDYAREVGARRLATFHHDPSHTDAMLDHALEHAWERARGDVALIAGMEGARIQL